MLVIAIVVAAALLLVAAALALRSWLTVPRATEDDRFRRAAALTSDWSRTHRPGVPDAERLGSRRADRGEPPGRGGPTG